ncbi:MAG TPA: TetR/AcrR family transcriptional regulator [Thermomicrobiales bacterium]|jgi:AcrR family transcriptional regulator
MSSQHSSESRERVLLLAEALFSERGYDSVTLRDIAEAIGIRQASLYHHVPGGKEQLYVEVTERGLQRHQAGLEAALATATGIRAQLRAAARWLLSQPPMNLSRLVRSDLPAIAREHADRLLATSYTTLFAPIERALRDADRSAEIRLHNPILLAATFISLIEGIWDADYVGAVRHTHAEMADELIDVLLDGLRPRDEHLPVQQR